jgi:hypothetical protein
MKIDLLHRPVVDLVGLPVGTVESVVTVPGPDGTPEIVTLVVVPKRWFGRRGGGDADRLRISWDLVAFCDRTITLMVRKNRLRASCWLEPPPHAVGRRHSGQVALSDARFVR